MTLLLAIWDMLTFTINMTESIRSAEKPSDLHDTRLARQLRELSNPDNAALIEAAADRIDRFNRLSRLLGLLAPAGTAPRTALEQIYVQSANPDVEETAIIADLRGMLYTHWAEWTPGPA